MFYNYCLDQMLDNGYTIQIFKDRAGEFKDQYLIFVYTEAILDKNIPQQLVCSRYGKTLEYAFNSAWDYLKP
jgi:hypothetical protein